MNFRRYQHIERFGTPHVNGIENGVCYVFPKIDGTNSSVWLGDDGQIKAGSRNRELSLEKDNAGFYNTIIKDERIENYLRKHPTHRLFGEFLVPHSLKTYRDDAWRKFYVFDVCIDNDEKQGGLEYIPYEIYQPFLNEFGIDYLVPLKIIKNGDYEHFIKTLEANTFLIKDGMGTGEGIVIKNYDFYNIYGRQIWAKIVTSEFRERHYRVMGAPVVENKSIEEKIVDEFVTATFVEKEFSKIVLTHNGEWDSKYIKELLGTIFYELVTEESWNMIKKYKNPTINYKRLNALTINKIKNVKADIFK